MDGKVNDFFSEIDSIVSTKNTNTDWQECYDESSGYPYYWNIKTDKVTWDIPSDYKSLKSGGRTLENIPPSPAPLFPSTAPNHAKNFKNQQDSYVSSHEKSGLNCTGEKRSILMSSYGDDSDSDNEEKELRTIAMVRTDSPPVKSGRDLSRKTLNPNSQSSFMCGSDEENTDLINELQNRAKVLTRLGGELPASVKKIVEQNGCNDSAKDNRKQSRKEVTGFSLVAGYSDSDEDEDGTLPITKTEPTNTLFPLSVPIDVTQFNEAKKDSVPVSLQNLETKPFQRKRRIGIDIIDGIKKTKLDITPEDERLGFGFKSEKADGFNKSESKISYAGFKSGGLMFVKPDDDKPVKTERKNALVKTKQKIDINKKYSADDLKKMEDAYKSVSEKLHFLAEGHETATPVQTMIIQMETLYDALKAKSLSIDYLYKWLQDTCTELVKLEKGAAPVGWTLRWDRIVKRYYYRNQQSGDCQWDFPQADIVGDVAMDISTTPPPPPTVEEQQPLPLVEPSTATLLSIQPPSPPKITSSTPPPPPPPTISRYTRKKQKRKGENNKSSRLSPKKPPLPKEEFHNQGEPLPPGVDLPPPPPPEIQPAAVETPSMDEDSLGSALNSFYSDLATLESAAPIPPPTIITPTPVIQNSTSTNENSVKKKKTKVKIVEGLAMKRKGVSKLVEKWKKVQKDY